MPEIRRRGGLRVRPFAQIGAAVGTEHPEFQPGHLRRRNEGLCVNVLSLQQLSLRGPDHSYLNPQIIPRLSLFSF